MVGPGWQQVCWLMLLAGHLLLDIVPGRCCVLRRLRPVRLWCKCRQLRHPSTINCLWFQTAATTEGDYVVHSTLSWWHSTVVRTSVLSMIGELSLAWAMTCSWRVTVHCMSAIKANSAIHPIGVDKWVVSRTQAFTMRMRVVAPPGECLRVKADMLLFAGNTVWSIPQHYTNRCYLYLTFTMIHCLLMTIWLSDIAEHVLRPVMFCSLAILDPRVGHTMDVLSPFISVLCHSDWLFHGESCPCLDVVHPGRVWSSSPACTWHCSLHYLFLQTTFLFPHGVTIKSTISVGNCPDSMTDMSK